MKYVKTYESFLNEELMKDTFSSSDIIKRAVDNGKSQAEAIKIEKEVSQLLKEIDKERNPITIYRIIAAKDENSINKNKLGTHFVLTKKAFTEEFLSSISVKKDEKLWVIECSVDKKFIKVGRTVDQNIEFPEEREIYVESSAPIKVHKVEEFVL
jgi:hypothetical protein